MKRPLRRGRKGAWSGAKKVPEFRCAGLLGVDSDFSSKKRPSAPEKAVDY
jgi:hypothetical protein